MGAYFFFTVVGDSEECVVSQVVDEFPFLLVVEKSIRRPNLPTEGHVRNLIRTRYAQKSIFYVTFL